jgi:hypothetical protein
MTATGVQDRAKATLDEVGGVKMGARIEATLTKILEFALERPVAALAILAALAGCIIGWFVGARGGRRSPVPVRQLTASAPSLSVARSSLSFLPLAVRLLSHPLVRQLLRHAINRAVARQLGR